MTEFSTKDAQDLPSSGLDLATFGQRLRHLRRAHGITLAELGERVGRAPSALSLLENGRREPKLSLIESLATALSVPAGELLRHQPPSRRAQLEIAVEEAQRDPVYRDLGLPHLKAGARVPNDVLEHIVALYSELRRQRTRPTATPEEARMANAVLRGAMRERGNYFEAIEAAAARALDDVSYRDGALSQGTIMAIVMRHGFAVRYAQDLPRSVRSVTDLRNHRIYLKQENMGMHSPRAVLLQTLGHFVLGHDTPKDFADFLRQRVEANYFAAAVLVPERSAARFLLDAKQSRELSGRQVFATADRFSPCYQYSDTPTGTFWCVAHVDPGAERGFAITLGTPYEHARWFRGRETTTRMTSACPDGECCQRPPAGLAARWDGMAWPSARAHSHILSALPTGSFPGVDETEVFGFLDRHERA